MLSDYLKKQGFSSKDYDNMVSCYGLGRSTEQMIVKHLEDFYAYFTKMGLSKQEITKMIKSNYSMLGNSIAAIDDKVKNIESLGYHGNSLLKILKSNPRIFTYSVETIREKHEFLGSLGFDNEILFKIIKTHPKILGYATRTIELKIKGLGDLGFSYEQIIKIFSMSPQVLSLSLQGIKENLFIIESFGYTKEQALDISTRFPGILCSSADRLIAKLSYYQEKNLAFIIELDPSVLMQSIELTKARLAHLASINYELKEDNFRRLFRSKRNYELTFGISNEELMEQFGKNNSEVEPI